MLLASMADPSIDPEKLHELFGDLFGGGQGQAGPPRGKDRERILRLTMEESVLGTERVVDISRRVLCRRCRGKGATALEPLTAAPPCEGEMLLRLRAVGFAARTCSS